VPRAEKTIACGAFMLIKVESKTPVILFRGGRVNGRPWHRRRPAVSQIKAREGAVGKLARLGEFLRDKIIIGNLVWDETRARTLMLFYGADTSGI
jgi:hypothetical protein